MAHYLKWLVKSISLNTRNGLSVDVLELKHAPDNQILSRWATRIRNHYCRDEEIDEIREPTGLSRGEYLSTIKFPSKGHILSGDFAEILVADYIQFVLKYNVPRTRYEDKTNRNTSTHGIDILAFKILNKDHISSKDKLLTCEVKAALQGADKTTLIRALNDSKKDFTLRKAESLNAMRQRLRYKNRTEERLIVERFQNQVERPYREISGAAAVHSNHTWNDEVVTSSDTSDHPNSLFFLLTIKGEKLMPLVYELYRRASDEA